MGVNLSFYPHHLPTMNTSQPLTYFDLVFAMRQFIVGALIIIPIRYVFTKFINSNIILLLIHTFFSI